MTEAIVEYLRDLAATVGGIEISHCLAERRQVSTEGATEIPYIYVEGGGYVPVEVDGGSVSYFRLVNPASFTEVQGKTAVKDLQGSFPFTFVAMVNRDETNPLSYSQDVANIFEGRNTDLKSILKSRNVKITVNSIDTDTVRIWKQEFQTPVTEPHYTRSMVMINLTVEIIASRECWQNCANYPDILQGFPWCSETAETLGRLTDEQVTCLEEYLCQIVPCEDATVQLNGVDMADIASGDTENILVLQSNDMTQVGSKQGTHWRIDDSAISINGSPVADVRAEDPLDIDVTEDGLPVGSWNGSAWILPILSVAVSDNTPTFIDTITIEATPTTGFVPVSYTFLTPNIDGSTTETTQVSNTLSWKVNDYGSTRKIKVEAVDASGAKAYGSVEVTPTWSMGKAIQPNGVNTYAESINNTWADIIGFNRHTFRFWFKADSLSNSPVIMTNGNNYWNVQISTTYVKLKSGISNKYFSAVLTTGQWYHCVIVRNADGDNTSIWLNGVELSVASGQNFTEIAGSNKLTIGQYPFSSLNDYNGQLTEICALKGWVSTAAQITSDYNSGNGAHPIALGRMPDFYLNCNDQLLDSGVNEIDFQAFNGLTFTDF